MPLLVRQLDPFGALVVDATVEDLLEGPAVPDEVWSLLAENQVLVFRGLELDDASQLAFARRLGTPLVKTTPGWSREHPGVYRVALAVEGSNDEFYVKGSWDWHLDGATSYGNPPRATMLHCRVPSAPGSGGETEFASTYAAYDRLTDAEKERFSTLKAWHRLDVDAFTADIRLTAQMRARLKEEPAQLQPLVWTHRDGRRSLVLSINAAEIEGMSVEGGAALLRELLDRATRPEHVLTHWWELGDLVIWDNTGTVHRGRPFEPDAGRVLHRVTLEGVEPIR